MAPAGPFRQAVLVALLAASPYRATPESSECCPGSQARNAGLPATVKSALAAVKRDARGSLQLPLWWSRHRPAGDGAGDRAPGCRLARPAIDNRMNAPLSHDDLLARLGRLAHKAIALYDLSPRSTATMINLSENATYRIDDPDSGGKTILRIHRVGYHSYAAINSELQWMAALRRDAGMETPEAIPARDGTVIQTLVSPELRDPRHAVMSQVHVRPRAAGGRADGTVRAAGRGVRAHARACQALAAAARLHPPHLGLRDEPGLAADLGALAGRHRDDRGTRERPRPDVRRHRPTAASAMAWRASASASPTPTSASPTC